MSCFYHLFERKKNQSKFEKRETTVRRIFARLARVKYQNILIWINYFFYFHEILVISVIREKKIFLCKYLFTPTAKLDFFFLQWRKKNCFSHFRKVRAPGFWIFKLRFTEIHEIPKMGRNVSLIAIQKKWKYLRRFLRSSRHFWKYFNNLESTLS